MLEKCLDKIHFIIEKIGKQNFILLLFIFIALVITGLYQTFSLSTISEGLSIEDGLKTYKFVLSNNDENGVTIAGNSSKNIMITVSNSEDFQLKYGIYYTTSVDLKSIHIGYLSTSDYPAMGLIESKKDYNITIKIDNYSDYDVSITFGTKYGLENGGDLILDEGQYWVEEKGIYLNEVKPGSYVAYTGNNGCTGDSCSGQNANYEGENMMGYCSSAEYSFHDNGWRVAYIKDETAYLISGGATDCVCTDSSGIASKAECDLFNDASVHIDNLNQIALKYCNANFAYDGLCNSDSAWVINELDFQNMTGALFSECDVDSTLCGSDNDLINNGGFYWYGLSFGTTHARFWSPIDSNISFSPLNETYGVRPILRLKSNILVVGGSGTSTDPYLLSEV